MYSAGTLEDFKEVLRNHEVETGTKFNVHKNPKGFLDENRTISADMKLHWKDGLPYFHLGTRTYTCHQGRDKNTSKKIKNVDKKLKKKVDPSVPKVKQLSTKKMDCPATISVTRIYALPQFTLENPIKSRKNALSTKIRTSLANNEIFTVEEAFWFTLPSMDDHKYHNPETITEPTEGLGTTEGLGHEEQGNTSKTNARKRKKTQSEIIESTSEMEASITSTSPKKNSQAKRPNQDLKDQGAFVVKMTLTKEGYPKNRLSPEDAINIQRGINEIIDNLSEEDAVPQFAAVTLLDGALVVHCESPSSAAWLQRYFEGSMLENDTLHVKGSSDVARRVRIALKTKDLYSTESKTLLRRLARLNPGLRTDAWQLKGKEKAAWQCVRWVFEVDAASVQTMRGRNMELFVGGFGKGLCKILYEQKVKNEKCQKKPSPVALEVIQTSDS